MPSWPGIALARLVTAARAIVSAWGASIFPSGLKSVKRTWRNLQSPGASRITAAFFDPDADTPKEMSGEEIGEVTIEAMVKAGIDPPYTYALKKTGLLVTRDNWDKLSPEDQAEWMAAMSEAENLDAQ
jgi:hypothetical protein